jgi:uncharacterized low-complexity protein
MSETLVCNQEKLTMSKTNTKKPIAIAMGAALTGGLLATGVANAAENPFGLSELGSGYMQVAGAHMEGKCGEGKCGGAKAKAEEGKCGEGKCGGAKAKAEEGKCGEGKCGGAKPKAEEGKCGEGKCGGNK